MDTFNSFGTPRALSDIHNPSFEFINSEVILKLNVVYKARKVQKSCILNIKDYSLLLCIYDTKSKTIRKDI